jgi:predicted MFS family arabinose efflux permease
MQGGARSTGRVTVVLGLSQTIGWASSYYLPAVLAAPMAAELGLPAVWVFAAFSLAMAVSAVVGPASGARVDAFGGRGVLILSNLVLAGGLTVLAFAGGIVALFLGWGLIGIGMGLGLYETAFATLARIYGAGARGPITGITLIAGFASTVGWPLSGLMLATWGWREACLGWALMHLCVALPLNALLPRVAASPPVPPEAEEAGAVPPPPRRALALLAFVFAATWFISTAMASHLPALLQAAGSTPAAALAAGALIGPAQVAARLLEYGLLRRVHPLVSARLAAAAHPVAAAGLFLVGGPWAFAFAVLHGAGNGILTIAKGTLPLALFGPAGYGARLGWLNAPARVLQAAAPLVFGAALSAWGAGAIWLTAAIGLAATGALFLLRRG